MALGPGQLDPIGFRQPPLLAEDLRRVGGDVSHDLARLALELGDEHFLPPERPLELSHVERVHPLQPVEVRDVVGRRRDHAGGPSHSVRHARGDCERVGAASRSARDREAFQLQAVGDRDDIRGAIHDASTPVPVRPSVTGPVVGDDPRPGLAVLALVVVPCEARVGRAVQEEDGEAAGVAPLRERQRAPVGRRGRRGVRPSHQS